MNNKFKKALSIAGALSTMTNISFHTHAADLVAIPQNVVRPIIPPSTFSQTNRSEISFNSFESKISNIWQIGYIWYRRNDKLLKF